MNIETLTSTFPRNTPRTFPPSPWETEPDKHQWSDPETGLPCLMVRGPNGSWCGYVAVSCDHSLFGDGYGDVSVNVHGGLTYSGEGGPDHPDQFGINFTGCDLSFWFFGFDCAHGGDLVERQGFVREFLEGSGIVYRDFDFVKEQVTSLATQLAAL